MQKIRVEDVDWRGSWVDLQLYRDRSNDPGRWDTRAASFAKRLMSSYSSTFIKYLDLAGGESILDMGCGTGELAIQLASLGHKVFAADFSREMLRYLDKILWEQGVFNVKPVLMSWEDDWSEHGIVENCVDVAIASRSMMVPDLGEAIDKLSLTAREKVAITLSTGSTPGEDSKLLDAIGRRSVCGYDLEYCLNILFQMGYTPELRYIESDKPDTYATEDEAYKALIKHLGETTPQEDALTREFFEKHMVCNEDDDSGKPFGFDYKRFSKWAFVSWEV